MIDVTKYESVITSLLARRFKASRGYKEDLSQECYLALMERQDELGGEDDADKARTICKTKIQEVVRSRKLGNTSEGLPVKLLSADDPNIAKQIAKIMAVESGTISELYEAVDTLNEEEQVVISSLFTEGLTQQKTAEKLGITEDAVRWRRRKGIESLKKHFEVENGA